MSILNNEEELQEARKLFEKTKSKRRRRDIARKNLAKARMTRKINAEKKRADKLEEVKKRKEILDIEINDHIEKKVSDALKKVNPNDLKQDFYKIFYRVGGVKGFVDWVKEDKKNRIEYYKMLVSLLRVDAEREQEIKQGVILNIITPDKKSIEVGQIQEGNKQLVDITVEEHPQDIAN